MQSEICHEAFFSKTKRKALPDFQRQKGAHKPFLRI